ncbi:hypothetical protein GIB67_030591 [Kingdonia uniflora]|uniref:DOG1 domain-containing protein n=1 Tax=Kingdonia uniflora TaxID=39325 RepID=A0A7J7PCJ4_9MAGN|nr:hypothetical protein GIB67_030591 [Kingdonia uniflora]
MATTSSSEESRLHCCFENWIIQQQNDLRELLQTLKDSPGDDKKFCLVIQKSILHFEQYYEERAALAPANAPFLFAPPWCTSFENSHLWIAGCRPSLAIRLIYTLSGSQIESHLTEYLQGVRRGNLGELTCEQLGLVNDLQCKIYKEEEKLSNKMASMQEDIADDPLALIANEFDSGRVGESNDDVDRALDAHSLALATILKDADKLRLSTLKELLAILTPFQAIDYLIAAKKLHLSMHEWGKRRDQQHGSI